MANKRRAKEDILGELHEALASDLLKRVKSGEATAQEINAAIKFLSENNIQAEIGPNPDEPMRKLAEILPQFVDED